MYFLSVNISSIEKPLISGIWLCYFTHKLYLHSPTARANTTLLMKQLAIFHSYSCNKFYILGEGMTDNVKLN